MEQNHYYFEDDEPQPILIPGNPYVTNDSDIDGVVQGLCHYVYYHENGWEWMQRGTCTLHVNWKGAECAFEISVEYEPSFDVVQVSDWEAE